MPNDETPSSDPSKAADAPATEPGAAGASEAAPTESASAAEVTPIGTELERVTAERDKNREQLLRTAADFDNYRKRARRELEDAQKKGAHDIVRDLLPVFDNLERAVQAATTTADATSIIEGVRMVLKLFEDTAERIGLSRVKTVGERFDPAVHEAIQQKESHDAAPGTILAEVAPGYRFGERLVRAAMVVVARKPSDDKKLSVAPTPAAGPGSPSKAPPAGAPASADGTSSKSDADTNGREGKGE